MLTNTNPAAVLRSDDITNDHRPGAAVGVGQALLIGIDASIETIDLTPCDSGTFGATIRQAIGCRLYTVTDATEHIDMWTDDESFPDFDDAELIAATLNPLATCCWRSIAPFISPTSVRPCSPAAAANTPPDSIPRSSRIFAPERS